MSCGEPSPRRPAAGRPLGKNQRQLLAVLAGVRMALAAPDKLVPGLVRRGLLATAPDDGSFAHITPAGLRAIADEIDAGRVEMFSPAKLRGGGDG